MTREWKPGDVAIIEGKVALYVDGPNVPRKRGPFCWQWGNGGWTTLPLGPQHPLVVIDPEDREQVERLTRLYSQTTHDAMADAMQAALREFANPTPPKPSEPQGLGAVVEDAEGVRWTLTMRPPSNSERKASPWCRDNVPARGVEFAEWDQIAAVRVLSEGVTP